MNMYRTSMTKLNFGKIYYGWWIALTALLINAILSGPAYGSTGLWIDSLEKEFGWGRTQLSIAFTLGQFEGGIAGPFVGYLIDKIGGKKVAMMGIVIAAIGFLILSQTVPVNDDPNSALSPLIFYFSYLLIMLGNTMGGFIPMMVVINNWFTRYRSLAMAVFSLGFSLGTFLIVPLVALLMSPSVLGWRSTAISVAAVAIVLPILVWKIIDDKPISKRHIREFETKEDIPFRKTNLRKTIDFTIIEAIKEKSFWLMGFGHGASAMLTSTMMVHLILAFANQGLSIQLSALMWGVAMGIGGIGQLGGGILGDRLPKELTNWAFGALQAVGVLMAIIVSNVFLAFCFAIVYGIGFGGRAPLTTAMRGEYFGRKSFGKIMGVSMIPMMALTLTGPWVASVLYERSGNYETGFLSIGIAGLLGSFLFLMCRKPLHPSIKNQIS